MIEVKEVTTRSDLKKFVEFPNKLYKGHPYYVPAISADEVDTFTPSKNPAYDFCETKLFLAYRNNKIVGRIGALINHAYIKKVDKAVMRFTRYDVIDDIEVSRKLFDEVIKWARSRNLKYLVGPVGFIDIDRQGQLVEGFEELNLTITIYNHDYYNTHLDQLGFKKDVDWLEFQVSIPQEMDPRFARLAHVVEKRYGFKLVKIEKRKDLYPIAREAFTVINEAYEKLYGTVYLTEKIVEKSIKEYMPLVNLDYVFVVMNKEDQLIGFGLALPSYAKALQKSRGHLFPFGLFRILHALKTNKVLEMYFVAVKPEYQNMGVNALIMNAAIEAGKKNNVLFAETGPELETNLQVQSLWKGFDVRQHKRRRSFIYEIEE